MSRVPRLLRTIHSSAARLNTAVSSSEAGSATSGGGAARSRGVDEPRTGSWANSHGETVPVKFTPKGRPLFGRPPRKTRVSLPSGYPEPPAYPPPAEYFKELDEITAALPAGMSKPKAHPLWAFFHVPPEAEQRLSPTTTLQDMGSLESMDNEVDARDSGRSWTSKELRQKSFEDLHILWYKLIREKNVLATQREERRRLNIPSSYGGELITKRVFRCRKSMARIKYILNERRLAIIAAGAPNLDIGDEVIVPFTVPGMNDPISAVEALAGAPPPDMLARMGRRSAVEQVAEEVDPEDAAMDAEVAAEEAEAKAEEKKEDK